MKATAATVTKSETKVKELRGRANKDSGARKVDNEMLDIDVMAMESKSGESAGKITIDSGAADSVLPRDMLASEFPLLPKQEGIRFVAANGNVIGNYGRRNLAFKTQGRSGVNCMTFHVTDVKKPLASVSKMVEKGSSVHFTPYGSYIEGPKGEKIKLVQEGGVYVVDVKFLTGFSGRA